MRSMYQPQRRPPKLKHKMSQNKLFLALLIVQYYKMQAIYGTPSYSTTICVSAVVRRANILYY